MLPSYSSQTCQPDYGLYQTHSKLNVPTAASRSGLRASGLPAKLSLHIPHVTTISMTGKAASRGAVSETCTGRVFHGEESRSGAKTTQTSIHLPKNKVFSIHFPCVAGSSRGIVFISSEARITSKTGQGLFASLICLTLDACIQDMS